MTIKDLASLIMKHTVPSRNHLTPELVFRLITRTCPLWSAPECDSPFKDPFWAFYWPGGQAAARYILDNGDMVKGKKVIDIGCGCGAGGIAASVMNAALVLANDIDIYAVTATEINAKMNNVKIKTSTRNMIGSDCKEFDTILIGDMFYNEEFADMLYNWLLRLAGSGKTILIGDPGRHGLTEKRRMNLSLLAKYQLPEDSCIENRGFTDTTLWKLK